jgi:hypothetical protein
MRFREEKLSRVHGATYPGYAPLALRVFGEGGKGQGSPQTRVRIPYGPFQRSWLRVNRVTGMYRLGRIYRRVGVRSKAKPVLAFSRTGSPPA